ncbi:MAG: SDR family oxidoreductase [Chitinophagales bacterium]
MQLSLKNKTALVCGSTQGIGLAAAQELAVQGARVILFARNQEKLEKAVATLSGTGHHYLVADFQEPDVVRDVMETYLKTADGPIHILVNNSGGPPPGKVSEAEVDAFYQAFNAHLICNHILAMALIPGMRKAGYGRIINIISTSVKIPLPNLGVSNTIRAAVGAWAKTMANELGKDNITVNNVLPGATATARLEGIVQKKAERQGVTEEEASAEMLQEIPMRRFGKPQDIAAAVAFLASEAAGYINGINLPVDGGRTASL